MDGSHCENECLISRQAFLAQEAYRDATKDLTKELEDFLSTEEQMDKLKYSEESWSAMEQMLDLISCGLYL